MSRVLDLLREPFWQGFIAGALFIILIRQVVAFLPWLFKVIRKSVQRARERAITGIGTQMRRDVFTYAQRQHLAALFFPLDEILITPRVLTPPVAAFSDDTPELALEDVVSLTIPYLPDWPQMGALYGAPTLTLPEALEEGANLILLGHPGMGKTVALASLALTIARRDPAAGKLNDYTPVLLHAADLLPRLKTKKTPAPVQVLCAAVSHYTSKRTAAQLPSFMKNALANGRVLLLLDGYDEAGVEDQNILNGFIQTLLETYPLLRLVVAAIPGSFTRLHQLGLAPVAIAAWSEAERNRFIQRWLEKWRTYGNPPETPAGEKIDPLLLLSWLSLREVSLTPLELTLKVWGALEGDTLGPEIPNLIEAHLRRLTAGIPDATAVLERLAVQMITNKQTVVPEREAATWVRKFAVLPAQEAAEGVAAPKRKKSAAAELSSAVSDTLYRLESSGILVQQSDHSLRFAHSVFMFYLAGIGFARSGLMNILAEQPDWFGKYETLGFVGCFEDVTPVVQVIMGMDQEPTHSKSLRVGRWLRISPKQATWRGLVMRYLVDLLHREYLTLGMSGRALTALALSGDPGVNVLFRQLMKGNFTHIKLLGALGAGMVFDSKAVSDLEGLFIENDVLLGGAACLALVAIHTRQSLETVMALLMHGSEPLRRAAAEALANDEKEGHPVLEAGASLAEDLLARRAVVYGLARVRQPWAVSLLEKMEIEDSQWVVRTAASQALEDLRKPNLGIPRPTARLHEQPWLVEYAARRGMGIAPGKPAMDMLVSALENGEARERLHCLEYFRLTGIQGYLPQLYQAYYGGQAVLRETAFNTLWHFAAAGEALPPAIQFGLG